MCSAGGSTGCTAFLPGLSHSPHLFVPVAFSWTLLPPLPSPPPQPPHAHDPQLNESGRVCGALIDGAAAAAAAGSGDAPARHRKRANTGGGAEEAAPTVVDCGAVLAGGAPGVDPDIFQAVRDDVTTPHRHCRTR
jgi:hypothetical protein